MAVTEDTVITMSFRQKKTDRPVAGKVEFEHLYHRYMRPVYSFIAWRIPQRAVAEDITSQVFEKAWRAFDGFDPSRASASTWIFTIARNCVTDHFRQSGRNPLDSPALAIDPDVKADSRYDPLRELVNREASRELALALSSLEPREQEIVALKFGSGMTNRDISRLLGVSESNTGTILYRSLQKLKAELEDGMNHD